MKLPSVSRRWVSESNMQNMHIASSNKTIKIPPAVQMERTAGVVLSYTK